MAKIMKKIISFMIIISLFINLPPSSCTPPEEPIKCSSPNNTNCTITNSYGAFPDRSTCHASNAAYPTTEQELIAVVADATRAQRKMKVATRYSHSIPKLVCLDEDVDGLLISTKYLNRVLAVDKATMTMSVESGVTLRQVVEEAAKVGMALPYTPYWWGLTVGGMLGTGAHGSSLWGRGSAIHDYVVQLTVVSPGRPSDGFVKVRTLKESNSDINAAKVSLGVLGVISKVTLKLQPLFKRSLTYVEKDDKDFADEAVTFGRKHEFADFSWFPSQGKVIYRIDDRVPSNTSGNGYNDFIPFRSTLSVGLAIIRSSEETQESTKSAAAKCLSGKLRSSTLQNTGFGITNNGFIFTGYPIVGYHNRLQASGTCLDSPNDGLITACAWDSRIKGEFFHQTTFSISLAKVQDFIRDVQTLVNQDPKSLCVLDQYNGILIRYVTSSSAYLGKQEDALDFDLTYYRSKDPMNPRLYEDVLEEIEQMAVFKYGALPHWGKNRNLVFDGVLKRYRNGGEFLKVKNKYDPFGLFSSQWTDQVLGLKDGVSIVKDGCALEGLCVCSQDSHCAPSKGYFCRAGKVYADARVCSNRSPGFN
ncbi:Probable L-gulonolactone oxidase 6 [Linum grandiflorum]